MSDDAQEQIKINQEQPTRTNKELWEAANAEGCIFLPEPGWEWIRLEVMGHRSHWGRAREEERFGAKMLRIDVPIKGDPATHGWSTHYYTAAAIFSYALSDQATVMDRNRPWEPPSRLSLPAPGTPDETLVINWDVLKAASSSGQDDDVPFDDGDDEEAA